MCVCVLGGWVGKEGGFWGLKGLPMTYLYVTNGNHPIKGGIVLWASKLFKS